MIQKKLTRFFLLFFYSPLKPPEGLRRQLPLVVLAAGVLYFLVACLLYLGRPGLHFDEGEVGISVMRYLHRLLEAGQPLTLDALTPPPLDDIEGSTLTAMLAFTLGIFGKSYLALRAPFVLLSLGTVLCLTFLLRSWSHRAAALAAMALLVTDSDFILGTRLALCRQGLVHLFFFWAALALLELFRRRGQRRYLLLAGLVLGLALNAKIMILGFLLAGFLAALAVWRGRLLAALRHRVGPVGALGFAACFLAGSAPFWIDHLSRGFASFGWVSRNFSGDTHWNNWDVGNNLLTRVQDLILMLGGQVVLLDQMEQAVVEINPLRVLILAAALIVLIFHLLRGDRALLPRRPAAFLLLFHALLLLLTMFVPGRHSSGHLVVLAPLYPISVGLALYLLLAPREGAAREAVHGAGRARQWAGLLLGAAALLGISLEVNATWRHLGDIRDDQTSKVYPPSEAREVARQILRRPLPSVINLSEFILFDVEFLSGGRAKVLRPLTNDLAAMRRESWRPRPNAFTGRLEKIRVRIMKEVSAAGGVYLVLQPHQEVLSKAWERLHGDLIRDGLRLALVTPGSSSGRERALQLFRITR